jgi:Putative peptidoglycan binding domain
VARTPEDDWFPQAGARSSRDLEPPTDDEWLVGDDLPPGSTAFDPWSIVSRRGLIATGFALVFLIALLAAFGVFSGGSPPTAGLTTSAQTTSTTRSATPAPPSLSSPVPPTTTLKPGDSGSQVKILQQELAKLGYPVGTIDGNYGLATTKAVAAFQRADHLTPDGIVGPSTLLALGP